MAYRSQAVQSAIYWARHIIQSKGWPDDTPHWKYYRQLMRTYYQRAIISQYIRRTYGR